MDELTLERAQAVIKRLRAKIENLEGRNRMMAADIEDYRAQVARMAQELETRETNDASDEAELGTD